MATAIERERATLVRAAVTEARKAWRLHRKLCRTCAQLSKDRSQYCDNGWAIRVELHHAEQANGDLRRAMPVRMDPLF